MKKDFQNHDWYDVPLYYDIIFDEDTKMEADFLQAIANEYCQTANARKNSPLVWVEPACGSGRLMIELMARDQKITGFDLSQNMLDFAEEAGRKAIEAGVIDEPLSLFKARMEDFKLPKAFSKKSGYGLLPG